MRLERRRAVGLIRPIVITELRRYHALGSAANGCHSTWRQLRKNALRQKLVSNKRAGCFQLANMKIPVTCSGCSRRYEVDPRYAGRIVNCAYCNQPMGIPNVEPVTPSPSPVHDEYGLGDPREPASSTYRAAPASRNENSEWRADRSRAKKKASGRPKRRRAQTKPAVSGPATFITLTALAILLIILAAFVPSTRKTVGVAVVVPGLLLFLYGYASGAYIAFTEDDLYLWLYILIPCYAAYYFVSRWDEMRSRLAMIVVGLILLSIGGRLLEAELVVKDTGKADGAISRVSDHFTDRLLFVKQKHRAAASVGYGGAGVDAQVVVERGEDVLERDGAILGVTCCLVG
jgi:hypothetical protein